MVEAGGGGGGGAMFPVVFFDGEIEANVGLVNVDPSLQYKAFQLLISQRIGISPNQITIYLVDRNKSKPAAETRRRIPITGKANFSVIAKVKDGSFLAVLKRSRKNRRSRTKPVLGSDFSEYVPAQNFILMRRNSPTQINDDALSGQSPDYFHPYPAFRWNSYSDDVFFSPNIDLYLKSFPKIEDSFSILASRASTRTSCVECRNKKLSPAAFHCCVDDAVTVGFRSPAGAISRPIKLSD